jgi:hypothetical protein
LTVLETSTWPGLAWAATRDPMCTAIPPTLPSLSSHSPVCSPARTVTFFVSSRRRRTSPLYGDPPPAMTARIVFCCEVSKLRHWASNSGFSSLSAAACAACQESSVAVLPLPTSAHLSLVLDVAANQAVEVGDLVDVLELVECDEGPGSRRFPRAEAAGRAVRPRRERIRFRVELESGADAVGA